MLRRVPGPTSAALALALLACRPGQAPTEVADPEPTAADSPAPAEAPTEVGEQTPPRPPKTIYRAELQRATSRGPGYLLRQLAPQPYRPAGRFQGWQITQVFPDDPDLCAPGCDLQAGDVIVTVNGNNLERPEQLSKLFAALPELSVLEVHSVRGGKARKIAYTIDER